MKFTGFLILALFYAVYIGKMLLQRRKGIQTDQMAKGKKKTNVFRIELALKVAAYAVVIEEILSLLLVPPRLPRVVIAAGAGNVCESVL